MNLETSHTRGVAVLRVDEPRLTYPMLSEFSAAAVALIGGDDRRLLVDLSRVTYVDSAAIGCLMDLYRQALAQGVPMKLAGVQKRVETMLTMTGVQNFLEVYADEASAIASFGV